MRSSRPHASPCLVPPCPDSPLLDRKPVVRARRTLPPHACACCRASGWCCSPAAVTLVLARHESPTSLLLVPDQSVLLLALLPLGAPRVALILARDDAVSPVGRGNHFSSLCFLRALPRARSLRGVPLVERLWDAPEPLQAHAPRPATAQMSLWERRGRNQSLRHNHKPI